MVTLGIVGPPGGVVNVKVFATPLSGVRPFRPRPLRPREPGRPRPPFRPRGPGRPRPPVKPSPTGAVNTSCLHTISVPALGAFVKMIVGVWFAVIVAVTVWAAAVVAPPFTAGLLRLKPAGTTSVTATLPANADTPAAQTGPT